MVVNPAVSLVALGATIYWVVSLIKDCTPPFNLNGVVTRASAFAAAMLVVGLVAHTRWATGIHLDAATTLDHLNWSEQAFIALSLASGSGAFNDTLRTLNRNDTSVLPTLLPDAAPTEPAAPVTPPPTP